jgi:transposase InsO family protein
MRSPNATVTRKLLRSFGRRRAAITNGGDVVASFGKAFFGGAPPPTVLTDNGAVFTAKQRGEGRVALEVELGLLGVKVSHSRPYHPQTCGKGGTVPPDGVRVRPHMSFCVRPDV